METEGAAVSVFPDLSVVTLKKRKHFQFLTSKLRNKGVNYRWGFPFHLLFDYQGKSVVIRTNKEAEEFLAKIGES